MKVNKNARSFLDKERLDKHGTSGPTGLRQEDNLLIVQELVQELVDSGIPKSVHDLLGYRSVSRNQAKDLTGYRYSGWIVPFKDPDGKHYFHNEKPFCRLKPDPGQIEDAKYLSPKDGGCRPYFSPLLPKDSLKPTKRIFIVEGEKKADALTHHGFPSIGLSGVSCWTDSRSASAGLLPELEKLHWKKREVFIVFDSDVTTKTTVRSALDGLCNALEEKGAIVRIVLLPCEIDGSKNGGDDFICRHGSKAFQKLVDVAQPFKTWKTEPSKTHHKAVTATPIFKKDYAYNPLIGLYKWAGTHWELLEEKPTNALDSPLHNWMDLMLWDERSLHILGGVKNELLTRLKHQTWNQSNLMSFKNGTYNLQAKEFEPLHRREDYLTHTFNFNYDPKAECPFWLKFLGETFKADEAVIQLLRSAFRWSVSTKRTDEPFLLEVFFDLYGPKGSGKGTLLEVLQALVGSESVGIARTSTFTSATQLQALVGKKIAVDMDASGHYPDPGVFNSIVSNELVHVKRLYVNDSAARLGVVIWRAFNDQPSISGGGQEGLGRRMVTFRIERSAASPDPSLKQKLRDEIEGVFQWCWSMSEADMFNTLKKRGEVKAVREASIENAIDQNPHLRFILEKCEEGGERKAQELYDEYVQWTKDQGIKAISQKNFGLQIKKLPIVQAQKKSAGIFYAISPTKELDLGSFLGVTVADARLDPAPSPTLHSNPSPPEPRRGSASHLPMQGMQGHLSNFSSKEKDLKGDIKEVSEKTLHTMHNMQEGGICYLKDMVEAALENGKNTVPEIQRWIKEMGKDIAKTEIEITLKRLERF